MAENPTVTSGKAPRIQVIRAHVPVTAITTNTEICLGSADDASTLLSAQYLPDGAATGDATNARTFTLTDETSEDVIATLALDSAPNSLVSEVAFPFTLSVTATNLNIAAGDVITFASTHTGTGVADPGGTLEVKLAVA